MEFRLLVPSENFSSATSSSETTSPLALRDATLAGAPTKQITVDGRDWVLSDPLDIEDDSLPPYTCVSYRWGHDRETHALFPDRVMSTHTVPSLATVIRSQPDRAAFWTDVFCVPSEESPSRQATLENLGYIYACAAEVVVVLGSQTFEVLQNMVRTKVVSEPHLQILESDQWIASVWTYQELANASAVRFVSEQSSDSRSVSDSFDGGIAGSDLPSIDCYDFVNALGHGIVRYQQSQDADAFDATRRFPNLYILENVLVDWIMGAYTQYSALAVFANVCSKRNESVANYYYAILGALSDSPHQITWPADETKETLAEKTMKICESKLDFSFIYSCAERDPDPKRRWRPFAADLPMDGEFAPPILRPIILWHHYGEAQSGTFNGDGELSLHNMTVMRCVDPPIMRDDAREVIAKWLGKPEFSSADDIILANLVYNCIKKIGFEGEATALIISDGMVFTLYSIGESDAAEIIISNDICFSQGAPGLVRYRDSEDQKRYSPCLFIGLKNRLFETGESVLL